MRSRTPAAAGITLFVLLICASGATAKAGPHACAATRTSGLQVSRIRTNLRCAQGHKVLKSLLRHGTGRLPAKRPRSRRWGCSTAGANSWSCRRRTRAGTLRLSFRVSTIPAPPAAKPVDPVLACVNRWNQDPDEVNTLGYHLATHHGVTRVWVFQLQTAGGPRCVVIAVVPAGDLEYGKDGAVSRFSTTGWDVMDSVVELGDPIAAQAQAQATANATLLPNGSLSLP
jgi:hypothetical protein